MIASLIYIAAGTLLVSAAIEPMHACVDAMESIEQSE
jgi:hypothetical protein